MQRSLEFGKQQENSPSRLERVILHLDLDCFYCQVEHARLNIPTNVPLAVQQWDRLIAVNYAARAAGVSRPASARDAVSKCPSLRLVHVPTFDSTQPEAGACQYPAMGGENGNVLQLDRRTCKASLQPYREASLKVFTVLRRKLAEYGAPFVMEKAGLDEVFFDVSSILDSLMNLRYGTHIHRGRLADNFTLPPLDLRWDVTTCGRGPIETDVDMSVESGVDNLRIHLGCEVAAALRQAVFQELKYTVSAGIAHNKTLAKLASACHKPNQQTYVLKAHVKPWMDKVPLRKIRFLGGKIGRRIQNTLEPRNMNDTEALDTDASDNDRDDLNDELGEDDSTETSKETSIITAADLWPLSVEELKERLGDAELAKWAYHIIRGEDNTPVTPRLLTRSFMAAKHMSPPIKEWSALRGWLQLLVIELSGRLSEDYQSNNRWPQSLTVSLTTAPAFTMCFTCRSISKDRLKR